MLTIYGVARSRAFRCLWAAEEAGIPFAHEAVAAGTPELRALNPSGKVPVLRDGALVLCESLAINLHIAAKAGPPLLPAGDDSDRTLQWTLFAATEAEPNVMQWAANTFARPAELRDARAAAAGRTATDQRLKVVEAALGDRPFLLGEAFSIADCNLAGVLYASWFNGYDLAAAPLTKAWLTRCLTRPAALRARRLREAG